MPLDEGVCDDHHHHRAVCQLGGPRASAMTGRAVAGALMEMSSRPGSLFRRPSVVIVTWSSRTPGTACPSRQTSCTPR
jgi:hypothetical protein